MQCTKLATYAGLVITLLAGCFAAQQNGPAKPKVAVLDIRGDKTAELQQAVETDMVAKMLDNGVAVLECRPAFNYFTRSQPMRRTKLVCTIGPACDSEEMLQALFEAGLNVARINFSHGDSNYHRLLIRRIKSLRDQLGMPVAILQDLQGPKIRVGKIESGTLWLGRGTTFVLTSSPTPGVPCSRT